MKNLRALTSLFALAGATFISLPARAQNAEASPNGKGIVGGALLGAELVMVGEAAFSVKPAWAYVVGGIAGGAAGGVGGYFVEQNTSTARVPMLMLAGGLACAIPTVVAVLSASQYEPPASYLQDEPPADEPLAEPPAPSGEATPAPAPAPAPAPTDSAAPADAPAAPPPAAAPTGRRYLPSSRRLSLRLPPPALLGVRAGADTRLALGVPNVEVLQAYSRAERVMFNAPEAAEVRIPVLDVTF